MQQPPSFPPQYLVIGDAHEGGMGAVWRVHYKDWGCDLAAKQPLERFHGNAEMLKRFREECEICYKLPPHPNVISTYYVMEIDGIPTAFSEWADGGDLEGLVKSEALYCGTPAEQLIRILDIVIQTARGLHHAHGHDIIHCDIKPQNVMFSAGTAKLTDFGVASRLSYHESLGSQYADFLGGSLPYCSPEQADSDVSLLSRRTDIYSWAALTLYLLCGKRSWSHGYYVAAGISRYLKEARVPVPDALAALLRECVKHSAAERLHDFGLVLERLEQIYQTVSARPYSRTVPNEGELNLMALNEEALCYIDLNEPDKALDCWERILRLDPINMPAAYNRALYLWRAGKITDRDAVYSVQDVYWARRTDSNANAVAYMLAQTMDVDGAIRFLMKMKDIDSNASASQLLSQLEPKATHLKRNRAAFQRLNGKSATCLAVNPVGDALYYASTARLVYADLDHCREEASAELDARYGGVTALAVSPDGATLAAGYRNGTVELRNARSLMLLSSFRIPFARKYAGVARLHFSSDQSWLLASIAGADHPHTVYTACILNGRDLSLTAALPMTSYAPFLAHPTDALVLCCSEKDGLHMRTGESFGSKVVYSLNETAFPGAIWSYAFSDDGRSVYFLYQGALYRWDYRIGKVPCICDRPAAHLALRRSKQQALLIDGNGFTRVVDLTNGRFLSSFDLDMRDGARGRCDLVVSRKYSCVYAISKQDQLWSALLPYGGRDVGWYRQPLPDAETEANYRSIFTKHLSIAQGKAKLGDYASALQFIASADAIPIRINAAQYDAFVREVHLHCRVTGLSCIVPDQPLTRSASVENALISASPDGAMLMDLNHATASVSVYDLMQRKAVNTCGISDAYIFSTADIAVSDGAYGAFAASRKHIAIYSLAPWSMIATLDTPASISAMAFSRDETRLAVAETNGKVHIFALKTKRDEPFTVKRTRFKRIAFDPDGRNLLLYTEDGARILQYDAQTLREVRVHHSGSNTALWHNHLMAFLPDGSGFCCYDGERKVFVVRSLDTGETLMATPIARANGLCCDVTGRFLYFLQDRSLVAFDISLGRVTLVRTFTAHRCDRLIASRDGERLYLGTPGAEIESLRIHRSYDLGEARDDDVKAYRIYRNRILARYPDRSADALADQIQAEAGLRGCLYAADA